MFSVFTNEQLADMVRGRVDSKAKLGKINGIGTSRIDKYGDAVLALLRQILDAGEKE